MVGPRRGAWGALNFLLELPSQCPQTGTWGCIEAQSGLRHPETWHGQVEGEWPCRFTAQLSNLWTSTLWKPEAHIGDSCLPTVQQRFTARSLTCLIQAHEVFPTAFGGALCCSKKKRNSRLLGLPAERLPNTLDSISENHFKSLVTCLI